MCIFWLCQLCASQVNNLICIEKFSDFPQLGRFTLRSEGEKKDIPVFVVCFSYYTFGVCSHKDYCIIQENLLQWGKWLILLLLVLVKQFWQMRYDDFYSFFLPYCTIPLYLYLYVIASAYLHILSSLSISYDSSHELCCIRIFPSLLAFVLFELLTLHAQQEGRFWLVSWKILRAIKFNDCHHNW